MGNKKSDRPLCGMWGDADGNICLCWDDADNRMETKEAFSPFVWADEHMDLPDEAIETEKLAGDLCFPYLITFRKASDYSKWAAQKSRNPETAAIRPIEHAWLLHHGKRLYTSLNYEDLRRCQLDIETVVGDGASFPNPKRKNDRVLAIGLRQNGQSEMLELEKRTDEAERDLLVRFSARLREMDPDVIEGHNIHKFDLDFLKHRCKRLKLPCDWGRFGGEAKFRNTRLRIAERWIDFPRCDIPGRTVCDTFFMVMLFDVTTRDLPSYSLKDIALYFNISKKSERTYLAPKAIEEAFDKDRDTFRAYLEDDLRETEGIANLLLPTYFAQTQNFPMTLQELLLRGTGSKIESIFLEKYYHAKHSIPVPQDVARFEGGFTKSYETGVFKHILHFDVASLYPSLLLTIGRNPYNDELGVFMPLLKELREYRLKYKKMAAEETEESLQREFQARQTAYKIVINSFYGYLGFSGARFGDGELAAEVTERGRTLLQELIAKFQQLGCSVLEADTDGIYISSEKYFNKTDVLLKEVSSILPKGIDLEYDGSYESMFCYKAKNYALYDGEKATIRGSALRSRGTEPYLKELTDTLIHFMLGASEVNPNDKIKELSEMIESGKMPVEKLARREYLSQNPEKYATAVELGKKSRRASLEVALLSKKPYKMGEQVAYYVTTGEKKRQPEWQIARPLEDYDPETQGYNVAHYLRKITDWGKRYVEFLETETSQGELF